MTRDKDFSDLLQLFLAPVHPYGYIYAHMGGQHKLIIGNYYLFETNQSHLCAAVNSKQVKRMSGQHVYTMICGRTMPSQKQIVRQRSRINAARYTALLDWYIKELGHHGYGCSQINNVPSLGFLVTETGQTTPTTQETLK